MCAVNAKHLPFARCAPGQDVPVVLDTNILLDLYVFQDPRAHLLRPHVETRSMCFLASDQTVAELANVLTREKFSLSVQRQNDILSSWRSASQVLPQEAIQSSPWRCKDRDDQVFLDLAWTRRPAVLLSKDLHVLRFAKRALRDGVQISTAMHEDPLGAPDAGTSR